MQKKKMSICLLVPLFCLLCAEGVKIGGSGKSGGKHKLATNEEEDNIAECAICCEGGGNVEKLCAVCNVELHQACLDRWVVETGNYACPQCKTVPKELKTRAFNDFIKEIMNGEFEAALKSIEQLGLSTAERVNYIMDVAKETQTLNDATIRDLLNKVDKDGYTFFLFLVRNDELEFARLILDNWATNLSSGDSSNSMVVDLLSKVDEDGYQETALHAAVWNQNLEMTQLIIDAARKANYGNLFKAGDRKGNSAFRVAALSENYEIAKLLIEKDKDVLFKRNKNGVTCLFDAFTREDPATAQFILDVARDQTHGNLLISVMLDSQDYRFLQTPLHEAAMNSEDRPMVQLILDEAKKNHEIELGRLLNFEDWKGNTPLLLAMKSDDYKTAKLLIDAAPDAVLGNLLLHKDSHMGDNVFLQAVLKEQSELTQTIMDRASAVRVDLVRDLLRSTDKGGETAFQIAVRLHYKEIAKILVDAAAPHLTIVADLLNQLVFGGKTDLVALSHREINHRIAKAIINAARKAEDSNSSTNAVDTVLLKNWNGLLMVFQKAVLNKDCKLAQVILEEVDDDNIPRYLLSPIGGKSEDKSPFQIAVTTQDYNMAKLLVNTLTRTKNKTNQIVMGALLNAVDSSHTSMIQLAVRNQDYNMAQLMIEAAREAQVSIEGWSADELDAIKKSDHHSDKRQKIF